MAGSFDPPTLGHIDLITRACALYKKILVVIAENPHKVPFLSIDERVMLLNEILCGKARVTVCPHGTLLVDFLQNEGIKLSLRGIRNERDFAYEADMARINKIYYPEFETILLPAPPEKTHISSGAVRELLSYNLDISGFVPEETVRFINRRKV